MRHGRTRQSQPAVVEPGPPDKRHHRAEQDDEREQEGESRPRACEPAAPAENSADRENDSQRLDALHQ